MLENYLHYLRDLRVPVTCPRTEYDSLNHLQFAAACSSRCVSSALCPLMTMILVKSTIAYGSQASLVCALDTLSSPVGIIVHHSMLPGMPIFLNAQVRVCFLLCE